MKCQKCGADLRDGAKFCNMCGEKQGKENTVTKNNTNLNKNKYKKMEKYLWIGIICIIFSTGIFIYDNLRLSLGIFSIKGPWGMSPFTRLGLNLYTLGVCIFLVSIIMIIKGIKGYKHREKSIIVSSVGIAPIVFGWILTIIGLAGTIISQIVANDQQSNYENRLESYFYEKRSNAKTAQIFTYISIGIMVIGIILLIIGYMKRGDANNKIAAQQMINELSENIASPALNNMQAQFEELNSLLQKGFITQEEFDSKRSELLKKL